MTSNFILQSLQKSPNLQILHFKELKRLVKEHDIRLREAEIHVQKELTDIPIEIVKYGAHESFTKYSEDVLQEIEATVAEVCTEVENERENLAKEMTLVTEDIENCMISFLKLTVDILTKDATIEEAKERLRNYQLDNSKKKLEADEAFRALFEERQELVNKQKKFLEEYKSVDTNQIVQKRNELRDLLKKKESLTLLHKSGWTRIAQELLEIPHLDRDTADLVQYLTKQLSCTIQETNKKEGRKTFSLHTAKHQNCIDLDGLVPFSKRGSLKRRGSVAVANDTYTNHSNLPNLFSHKNIINTPTPHAPNRLQEDVHSLISDIMSFRKRDYCLTQKLKSFLSEPQSFSSNQTNLFSSLTYPKGAQHLDNKTCSQLILAQTLAPLDSATLHVDSLLKEEPHFQTLMQRFTPRSCETVSNYQETLEKPTTTRFHTKENDLSSSPPPPTPHHIPLVAGQKKQCQRPPPPHQVF